MPSSDLLRIRLLGDLELKRGDAVLVLPPSVSGVPQVKDYIGLFDYDVAQLVAAFKKVGVSR